MDHKGKEEEQQQQLNQQNQGEVSYPSLDRASAPTDFPTPPPQYSVADPAFSQKPETPFLQRHQQQQLPIQQQFPIQQQIVVLQIPLERHPVNTICPSCHANIITRVSEEANATTHLAALLLCLVFPLCSCVPYCVPSCQSTLHSCPKCQAYIGSFRG